MKHQEIINALRSELSAFVLNIEGASAMQLYDLAQLAEGPARGLLSHILDLPDLRNLNAEERKNYPGIDLADDTKRVAVQVTATTTLDKVKSTLDTFLKYRMESRYDRLLIYVLGRKQGSYSQTATDKITQGGFDFKTDRDVIDYLSLLERAVHLPPQKALAALEILQTYQRGIPRGLAAADYDPPTGGESTTLNLIELYLPTKLYVGDLLPEVKPEGVSGRAHKGRNYVRDYLKANGHWAPTDFELNARRIITFHDLENSTNPFANVVDTGTITPLSVSEFCAIDDDHERIFKSLLRFCLQAKLYRCGVHWKFEDDLFIFVPLLEGNLQRDETWWTGNRSSSRRVFERKLNRNDPEKTFICKHLAFGVDFTRIDSQWYAAITPDWFFSFGDGYRRSMYADDSLSWLKRRENNRTVYDHFRFIAAWLKSLDEEDMFKERQGPPISFGEGASLLGHPPLDDGKWLPVRDETIDDPMRVQEALMFETSTNETRAP